MANTTRRVAPELESAEQAADLLVIGRPAERQRPWNDLRRNGTDGNERDVIANLADGGRRLVARDVDALQCAESECAPSAAATSAPTS